MCLDGSFDGASVAEVERLALQAWPGLEIEAVDGWLLRHANGITRRANSVWPNDALGESALDVKLARVESFYHARGLPARYQISPAAQPAGLDELLAQRGYRAVARTAVQTNRVNDLLARVDAFSSQAVEMAVEVTPQPSSLWWHCYTEADEVTQESVAARQAICAEIKLATAYAMAMHEGETIAVGSAAVGDRWVGFFNVATLPGHRRTGAARAVMAALSRWGQAQGATRAYLQVMAGNEAAMRLYARLGFATSYEYHYREEVR